MALTSLARLVSIMSSLLDVPLPFPLEFRPTQCLIQVTIVLFLPGSDCGRWMQQRPLWTDNTLSRPLSSASFENSPRGCCFRCKATWSLQCKLDFVLLLCLRILVSAGKATDHESAGLFLGGRRGALAGEAHPLVSHADPQREASREDADNSRREGYLSHALCNKRHITPRCSPSPRASAGGPSFFSSNFTSGPIISYRASRPSLTAICFHRGNRSAEGGYDSRQTPRGGQGGARSHRLRPSGALGICL